MVSWDPANCIGMLASIFIDNIRDEGYRINQITIKCIEKSQAKTPLYNAAIDRVSWIFNFQKLKGLAGKKLSFLYLFRKFMKNRAFFVFTASSESF
jgi:hypothetical protein